MLVFTPRNNDAEKIALKLAQNGIIAADLSTALHKEDRKHAMDGFRKGEIRVVNGTTQRHHLLDGVPSRRR